MHKVRYGTLKYAIVAQLQNPSKGFEQVIREHFRIKKPLILRQLDLWLADAQSDKAVDYAYTQDSFTHNWGHKQKYAAALKAEADQVRIELGKL